MDSHFRNLSGIRLHHVEQGEGPLVLLLHGFPDFWYSWRQQIPALSAAGYRVVAPDLRGYNLSDKPHGVAEYTLPKLAGDIVALIEALDAQQAIVIGHDWGGVIAWHIAMHHAQHVRALVIINAPHPETYRREVRNGWSQRLRSWYVAFFQLPKMPELMFYAANRALLERMLRKGPAENDLDVARYLDAFRDRTTMTAAINYYRAFVRFRRPRSTGIEAPTLLLWGERDPFLVPELTQGLETWVKRLRVVRYADASHWVHLSHFTEVNHEMLSFMHTLREESHDSEEL